LGNNILKSIVFYTDINKPSKNNIKITFDNGIHITNITNNKLQRSLCIVGLSLHKESKLDEVTFRFFMRRASNYEIEYEVNDITEKCTLQEYLNMTSMLLDINNKENGTYNIEMFENIETLKVSRYVNVYKDLTIVDFDIIAYNNI